MNTKLPNLSLHSKYEGTDEVIIGDESSWSKSHVGTLYFVLPNHTFYLCDTLCVPTIQKNLIFVHHFIKYNNVYPEFTTLIF